MHEMTPATKHHFRLSMTEQKPWVCFFIFQLSLELVTVRNYLTYYWYRPIGVCSKTHLESVESIPALSLCYSHLQRDLPVSHAKLNFGSEWLLHQGSQGPRLQTMVCTPHSFSLTTLQQVSSRWRTELMSTSRWGDGPPVSCTVP